LSEIETRKHIQLVAKYLHIFASELLKRASEHDQSKLEEPEAELFAKYTPLLRGTTYGSPEYQKHLEGLKVALDHHYAHNRHHPEYNNANICGMNLVDIVEMICDWLAATKRHADGDIEKSISLNQKRFDLDEQLTALLRNTVVVLESKKC
jgi:hypothetical protein